MTDRPSPIPVSQQPERSEFGDFCVVLRRAMMMVCVYVEKRYGTDEPRIFRPERDDGKKRAA